MQWIQIYDPFGRWWLSTLVAALPIMVLFGLLGGFNVTTGDNVTHLFGCAGGTPSPAPQDPLEWTCVRFRILPSTT